MILIKFDPSSLDPPSKEWWEEWSAKAEQATNLILEAFENWLEKGTDTRIPFDFKKEIWTELKKWLLKNVFHNKCAYCECRILRFPGDAEHYRPKASVRKKPVCEIPDPVSGGIRKVPHPGYFWLAYDWRNLVPSCSSCNSGMGKSDHFDVAGKYVLTMKLTQADVDALPIASRPRPSKKWPGHFYPAPAVLDQLEDPLLLNPLNAPDHRNPRKHLLFGVRGIVAAKDKSPIGRTSIDTFRLEDEELREARQIAQEDFQSGYYDALRTYDPNSSSEQKVKALLQMYSKGQHPFSAAALDYLQILRDRESQLTLPE